MKLIRFNQLNYVYASHEDSKNPGNLKKVLVRKEDLIEGQVQMVNWAKIPIGKAFRAHYHENMEEIFIIIKGNAEMTVGTESVSLGTGDTVIVPIGKVHVLKNVGEIELEYLVMGVARGTDGKTIVVE